MSDGFDLDLRDFESALKRYEEATGKDSADVLNHAARNVAFRAASFTPKAKATKITKVLNRKVEYTDPHTGRTHQTWLKYPLANAKLKARGIPPVNGAQMAAAANKLLRRQLATAGYGRAGWIPAIIALGGNYRGAKLRPSGLAAEGFASKARPSSLEAVIVNCARGVGTFGAPALQEAVNFVAADLTSYAARKLAARAKQFSAS